APFPESHSCSLPFRLPSFRWLACGKMSLLVIYRAFPARETMRLGLIPVKLFLMEHRVLFGGSHRLRPPVSQSRAHSARGRRDARAETGRSAGFVRRGTRRMR